MTKHALVLGLLSLVFFSFGQQEEISEAQAKEKLAKVFELVYRYYVDSVDADKIVDDAITGLLEDLDPHSSYITRFDKEAMTAPLRGDFEGVGIRFQIYKDTLLVIDAIAGGPSYKAGVKAGDKIIMIDDTLVAGIGLKNSDVRSKLLGEKGSLVTMKVQRGKRKRLLEFKVIRDKIPIHSVETAYMVNDEVGYIRISQFSANTMDEYYQALKKLKEQGMEDLILDLQNNGGGYMNQAIGLADDFLDEDELIVYTEGRAFRRQDFEATAAGLMQNGKLVVLVNSSSASASEIVSGAIQDWDRGVIVGRRTFGKGLVQRPLELPDGSELRLTLQYYYTPSGRSIQKPYVNGRDDYRDDFKNRVEHGELMHEDSIQVDESLKYETLKNGRTVYGGGGVLPDVFVPLDTTENSDYFSDLINERVFNDFALDYIEANRKMLGKKYDTIDTYVKEFVIEDLMDEFIAFATEKGVEFNEDEYNRSKRIITVRLKAQIAANLFDFGSFYRIINEINDSYLEAIKVINNDELYNELLNE